MSRPHSPGSLSWGRWFAVWATVNLQSFLALRLWASLHLPMYGRRRAGHTRTETKPRSVLFYRAGVVTCRLWEETPKAERELSISGSLVLSNALESGLQVLPSNQINWSSLVSGWLTFIWSTILFSQVLLLTGDLNLTQRNPSLNSLWPTLYQECWHYPLELGQSVCEERVVWDIHEQPLSPEDAESQELVDHQQASCHLLLLQSTRGNGKSPPAVLSECRWSPSILEPGLRVGVICHLQRVLHPKEESTPALSSHLPPQVLSPASLWSSIHAFSIPDKGSIQKVPNKYAF